MLQGGAERSGNSFREVIEGMSETEKQRLVERGEDIVLLKDHFFVVDDNFDQPDHYLIIRREAEYAATVVAKFDQFDYAHFCAKRLNEYEEKHHEVDEIREEGK